MKSTDTVFDMADYVGDDNEALLLLEACLEQDDGNGRLVVKALHAIARARKTPKAQWARAAGISRDGLYRALDGPKPGFGTVIRLARALGFEMSFQESKTREPAAV